MQLSVQLIMFFGGLQDPQDDETVVGEQSHKRRGMDAIRKLTRRAGIYDQEKKKMKAAFVHQWPGSGWNYGDIQVFAFILLIYQPRNL